MIKCIFTSNTVTLKLTDYESQSYLSSVHFLVLDSDTCMLVSSLCYVWNDFLSLLSDLHIFTKNCLLNLSRRTRNNSK